MTDFETRYAAARKAVISRDFQRLNPMQRQAAMTTEGPLLLLAGAGSGKTTVLIQRVYNLLTYGRGSDSDEVVNATEDDLAFLEHLPENPEPEDRRRAVRLCALDVPRPWEIIAITFTNKAAGELKDRLAASLGPVANDIWASTFHSACVRILRREVLTADPAKAAAQAGHLLDRPVEAEADGAHRVPTGAGRADLVFLEQATLAARHPGVPLDGLPREGAAALVQLP